MREFKIGKYKVCIVNRYTGGMEINERNPKYDIRYFSEELGGWVRLASCMTIAGGKKLPVKYYKKWKPLELKVYQRI